VLIDGRNRLAACEIAKVEPRFAKLPDGSDPLAYIESMDTRRSVTKGQRAMATAMRYPEPAKRGRGNKSPQVGNLSQRVSDARFVLHHSRSLAESVLKGIAPLKEALATAKQEQQYQQSDEAKLQRLQKAAPDLAEQVNEERLKINEAIAALQVREQELARICEDGRRAAQDIVGQFAGNVTAIIQALDSGEPITIPERQMSQLHKFYALLSARIPNSTKST
jgi:vacuolar-type H+-ATPase subunit I/STV1